jgi:hypothetical protein
MVLIVLDKHCILLQKTAGSVRVRAACMSGRKEPHDICSNYRETYRRRLRKEREKAYPQSNLEMLGAFDGIDSDLRLNILLGR